MPPYVVAALLGVGVAVLSDAYALRWPCVLAGHALCAVGFGIQISDAHFAAKYVGTFFCVAGSYGAFPAAVSWCVWCVSALEKTSLRAGAGYRTILRGSTSVGRRLR